MEIVVDTWRPIETVPRDGSIVRLRDKNRIYNCLMYWNKREKRWEGISFGLMGITRTMWDEDFCAIAEWKYPDPH